MTKAKTTVDTTAMIPADSGEVATNTELINFLSTTPPSRSGRMDRLRTTMCRLTQCSAIWGWDVGHMIHKMHADSEGTEIQDCMHQITAELRDTVSAGLGERTMFYRLKIYRTFPDPERIVGLTAHGLSIDHFRQLSDLDEDDREHIIQEITQGKCDVSNLKQRIEEVKEMGLVPSPSQGGSGSPDEADLEDAAAIMNGDGEDEDEGNSLDGPPAPPPLPGAGPRRPTPPPPPALNKFSEVLERSQIKLQEHREPIEGILATKVPAILEQFIEAKLPPKVRVEAELSGQLLVDSAVEMANALFLCVERVCATMNDVHLPVIATPQIAARKAQMQRRSATSRS